MASQALLNSWCDWTPDPKRKFFRAYGEREGGRAAVRTELVDTVRSHYVAPELMAEDIELLGYGGAADAIQALLPVKPSARAGDLGEILATEVLERILDFCVPVRRLRYKDARNMALRGDDFLGVKVAGADSLHLLKGESKSRKTLSGGNTLVRARAALDADCGRCTSESLSFIANLLLAESDAERRSLGRRLRNEISLKELGPDRIEHMLFTLSGNPPPAALRLELDAADPTRRQHSVNLHIADYSAFIKDLFEEVAELGDP